MSNKEKSRLAGKKLSKAEMKKVMGGGISAGCGSPCYYVSGGIIKASVCVIRLPVILGPLPGVIPPSCVCKGSNQYCYGDWVVV